MINYSISLRANPSDQDAPKKAYANAQYSEIMTLDKFAEHISTHGSKYNRADIQAVLIQAVDCMREQLLAGQRIQMLILNLERTLFIRHQNGCLTKNCY